MSRNPLPGFLILRARVTSREGRVSRNRKDDPAYCKIIVTSREGRVSRNATANFILMVKQVTSREGRVSRNLQSVRPR